jgi:hypothetical protein
VRVDHAERGIVSLSWDFQRVEPDLPDAFDVAHLDLSVEVDDHAE